jgi:hypothetical protein
MLAEELIVLGNQIEAGFWILLGAAFAGAALRLRAAARRRCLIAAPVLVLFGCSDLVEAQTGAWWQPWWLLVWKVVCVLALAALLVHYWRARQR